MPPPDEVREVPLVIVEESVKRRPADALYDDHAVRDPDLGPPCHSMSLQRSYGGFWPVVGPRPNWRWPPIVGGVGLFRELGSERCDQALPSLEPHAS